MSGNEAPLLEYAELLKAFSEMAEQNRILRESQRPQDVRKQSPISLAARAEF